MIDLASLEPIAAHKQLENAFRRLFSQRFKNYCPITSDDAEVFQWLAMEFGVAKGTQLIEAYFRSTDKFIVNKGFAPKFIKTSIAALLAALGGTVERAPTKKTIQIPLSCDKCFAHFVWNGNPEDLGRSSYMRLCKSCSGTRNGSL